MTQSQLIDQIVNCEKCKKSSLSTWSMRSKTNKMEFCTSCEKAMEEIRAPNKLIEKVTTSKYKFSIKQRDKTYRLEIFDGLILLGDYTSVAACKEAIDLWLESPFNYQGMPLIVPR
jgi:hypothetical protein